MYISVSVRPHNFLSLYTRRVLHFELFIIFLYYPESSGSVTEVYSFTDYSRVMLMGGTSPQSSASHRFLSESILRTKNSIETERNRETKYSSFSFLVLWKMHRSLLKTLIQSPWFDIIDFIFKIPWIATMNCHLELP